jgi:hypothetical protein
LSKSFNNMSIFSTIFHLPFQSYLMVNAKNHFLIFGFDPSNNHLPIEHIYFANHNPQSYDFPAIQKLFNLDMFWSFNPQYENNGIFFRIMCHGIIWSTNHSKPTTALHVTWNVFWRIILFIFIRFLNSKDGVGVRGCVCHFYFFLKWCAKFYEVQLIHDEVKFIINSNVNMVFRICYENTRTMWLWKKFDINGMYSNS